METHANWKKGISRHCHGADISLKNSTELEVIQS